MRYLVTFKPLGYFFFGNERTFSEDYVAKSAYFPQNTQLLGALRRFLAEEAGLLKVHGNGRYPNKEDMAAYRRLTGTATTESFENDDNLGAISYLSSMFLVNEKRDDALFRIPFDVEVNEENVRRYTLANVGSIYTFIDYDAKNASKPFLGGEAFWEAYLSGAEIERDSLQPFVYAKDKKKQTEEGIFVPHAQVGIGLDRKQVIEKMFYRKEDFTLAKAWQFACVVELDDTIMKFPKKGMIQIGAEGSMFALESFVLEEEEVASHPVVSALGSTPNTGNTHVCISDVMVSHTDVLQSDFALIPYERNMAMLVAPKGKYKGKSRVSRLVPKGSVLYYYEAKACTATPAPGAYAKMGYNQIIAFNR